MSSVLIIVALVLACTVAAIFLIRKIRYGSSCCGEREAGEKKIKVQDKNKAHYPYSYKISIDGMHCANCARKVENILHSLEGVWAKTDISQKQVLIRCKNQPEIPVLEEKIRDAGYTMLSMSEIK